MSRSATRTRSGAARRRRGQNLKVAAAVLLLVLLFVVGRMVELDEHLKTVQGWIWGFGLWGPVVYVLLFVAATLVLAPATPLTILAPFLFGTVPGYLAVTAATTASSVTGFLIARTFGRRTAERMLGETDAFRKIRRLVETNRRIAIPFIRLVPMLPFAMNDYALGLTRISFWSYLFWSQVVFIPMNAVIVLGAGAIYAALVRGEASWWLIGLSVGAAALILGVGFLIRKVIAPEGAGGAQGEQGEESCLRGRQRGGKFWLSSATSAAKKESVIWNRRDRETPSRCTIRERWTAARSSTPRPNGIPSNSPSGKGSSSPVSKRPSSEWSRGR